MTDTTDLGTITVTGQRRPPDSAPSISFNGRFDSPSPQVDYEPKPGETPIDEQPHDRCADPVTALPWNADAAGAAAVNNFLAKAAEIGFADAPNGVPNLLNREFGNFLLRGTGQSIEGTPVTAGLAGSPTDLEWTCTIQRRTTIRAMFTATLSAAPYRAKRTGTASWRTIAPPVMQAVREKPSICILLQLTRMAGLQRSMSIRTALGRQTVPTRQSQRQRDPR